MSQTAFPLPPVHESYSPLANARAAGNVLPNLVALQRDQPAVAERLTGESVPDDTTFLLARDGSLTAKVAGQWWGGNSLPLRSAEAMLKDVTADVAVSCMIAPVHAAQVRHLLDKIEPQHAVLVIQPDAATVAVMLRCANFTTDITAGRLWIVTGESWATDLDALLTSQPGLPVPGRFVRTPDVDDATADPLLSTANTVFGRHIASRARQIASIRSTPPRHRAAMLHIGVITSSRFRLWSNAGNVLASTLATSTPQHVCVAWETVDLDTPTTASPLAIAQLAQSCDAIVAADLFRADHPNLLPASLPWVTWATTPRVGQYDPASPHDRLMIADPSWRSIATDAGWPADRIVIASWPTGMIDSTAPSGTGAHLALLADVHDLTPPKFTESYSSHRLAWEAIASELTRDPFAITRATDVNRYLDGHLARFNIARASIDRGAFVERLILPAFTIGLAGVLLEGQVPLALHGRGWETTNCHDHARGPVTTHQRFVDIVQGATGLVRPWPLTFKHEIDTIGRPVLTAVNAPTFLAEARAVLAGGGAPRGDDATELISASKVIALVINP
jgi:hypothetical protein